MDLSPLCQRSFFVRDRSTPNDVWISDFSVDTQYCRVAHVRRGKYARDSVRDFCRWIGVLVVSFQPAGRGHLTQVPARWAMINVSLFYRPISPICTHDGDPITPCHPAVAVSITLAIASMHCSCINLRPSHVFDNRKSGENGKVLSFR